MWLSCATRIGLSAQRRFALVLDAGCFSARFAGRVTAAIDTASEVVVESLMEAGSVCSNLRP